MTPEALDQIATTLHLAYISLYSALADTADGTIDETTRVRIRGTADNIIAIATQLDAANRATRQPAGISS